MMYVVLVAFVSEECNGPKMQPIAHEKWKQDKRTDSRSLAQLDLQTGVAFTKIVMVVKCLHSEKNWYFQ